jgi:hypothetical protein
MSDYDTQALEGAAEYFEQLATGANPAPLAFAQAIRRAISQMDEMTQALRLHQAWSDSESAGPDYGGQSRDTHPDGERIWRDWWDNQLDLCARATTATTNALQLPRSGS